MATAVTTLPALTATERTRQRRRRQAAVAAAVMLAAAVVANLANGAFDVAPSDALEVLYAHLTGSQVTSSQTDAVVWTIRLPRILLGLLVGAGLGGAGAALQGVFRNPLAEPALIGVSSGAAVGAVFAITAGLGGAAGRGVSLAAFLGAMAATSLVLAVGRSVGSTDVASLILAGIAVSLAAQALTGLMTFTADDDELRSIVFWSLGSLAGSTWQSVASTAPLVVLGLAVIVAVAGRLDLLALGDREAAHLGVGVDRIRHVVIAAAALVTAAGVAVAGIIGFVGLVVPHLVRLMVGPAHRWLVPLSIAGGAVLLSVADLIARTVVVPSELPLGVVTALIGSPYLLVLIARQARQEVQP